MTRLALAALLALAACKDRGTIAVPIVDPCGSAAPATDGVAVYLVRAADCSAFRCGLSGFSCTSPDCTPLCASQGYCTTDELDGLTIDPPRAGEYVLLFSYHYKDAATDQGLTCYELDVSADGTASKTLQPKDAHPCCCQAGPSCS